MNASDLAGIAALTIIVVPLSIAIGASMKPAARPPADAAHERAPDDDTASA